VRVVSIGLSNAVAVADEVRRSAASPPDIREATLRIVDEVRRRGDAALVELASELDGVALERSELVSSREEAREAFEALDGKTRSALLTLRRRIEAYESRLLSRLRVETRLGGCHIKLRPVPLESIGGYSPGGLATYPSTILMLGVPGLVAGVGRLVLATPPRKDARGRGVVLAAAYVAGFGEVLWAGGAQAVAALAYGTESVRPVEKVVGPGNLFVQEAKRLVAWDVGVDFAAGPTELVVVIDSGSPIEQAGYELLAQAEHSPDTLVGAVATDREAGEMLLKALERMVSGLPENAHARRSIMERGFICVAESLEAAASFTNRLAPEHLLVYARVGGRVLKLFKAAGVISYGRRASSAYLDYFAGPSHVLPTGGAARLRGGLSVLDYVRLVPYVKADKDGLKTAYLRMGPLIAAEGLPLHLEALRRSVGHGEG
jgi:histidinol dehydrogenase